MGRGFAIAVVLVAWFGCGGDDGDSTPGTDAAGSAIDGDLDAAGAFDPLEGIGTVDLVQDGFQFTEGPTWREADGVLLFSDIPANQILRLRPPDSIDTFRSDSGNSNGLDTDAGGRLLAAEHGNRRVSRTLGDGTIVDVATEHMGMSLNSPNDIAVRSDGTFYFTDPPFGINPGQQELAFNGVFRVDTGENVIAEHEGPLSSRPNGIALSPDESTLYVVDTAGDVTAWDVAADGSLGGERTFADDVTNGDGMAVDTGGNLFVTAADGVRVYGPDGSLWGVISVPRQPANCAFGDPDARTLYITARQGLYRVRVQKPGIY